MFLIEKDFSENMCDCVFEGSDIWRKKSHLYIKVDRQEELL